ncbi:MAG: DUF1028 domain-containing protein, partial [Longispora sp.]|nr:DUF1028 domain-containing protein [Longispora sp. (in: high G+C Gram-positive bacteria)]
MLKPVTTFSIVARCPDTGQLGVAVSTADVGAGRMVAWARAGVGAVATLSWPNPYIGIDGLNLMSEGKPAPEVLAQLIAEDPGRELRQAGIVDSQGRSDAWSGSGCTDWYGHVVGDGFAVQGNMLVGSATVKAMAEAFTASRGEELAERLLRAIEVGQAAGGDKRGRQCSGLLVVDRE